MTEEEITRVMQEIRLLVGELPIVESEQRKESAREDESLDIVDSAPSGSHSYVTADGTYATQSALSSTASQVCIQSAQSVYYTIIRRRSKMMLLRYERNL